MEKSQRPRAAGVASIKKVANAARAVTRLRTFSGGAQVGTTLSALSHLVVTALLLPHHFCRPRQIGSLPLGPARRRKSCRRNAAIGSATVRGSR